VTTVGILLFDGAEELDFVGPWEVYAMAAMADDAMTVVTVSETGETVTCAKGMRVVADHGFADAPAIDVLVVPGGEGTRREADNQPLLDWIACTAERCQWVTSVCTGSLLLALAGPAAGRRVTTHWSFVEALRKKGCAGEVVAGTRYVRDGNVVTSAGVSAGIDMSLWVLGQMTSPATARQVQHYMEYDPAPPYTADV
jgi:transcriptional regulator GlxA family with amidase domain